MQAVLGKHSTALLPDFPVASSSLPDLIAGFGTIRAFNCLSAVPDRLRQALLQLINQVCQGLGSAMFSCKASSTAVAARAGALTQVCCSPLVQDLVDYHCKPMAVAAHNQVTSSAGDCTDILSRCSTASSRNLRAKRWHHDSIRCIAGVWPACVHS